MVNWQGALVHVHSAVKLFGVVVFHTSMVKWRGSICPQNMCAFCYMLNIFGVVVFNTSMVNWSGGLGTSALSICAFCYMWNLFSVVVFHRYMVNWRKQPWYMCILLSVKLFWCSSIPYIYGQLEGSPSALSICAFCYMLNIFGVVVYHTSMVNWRRGPWHMCILPYVKNLV